MLLKDGGAAMCAVVTSGRWVLLCVCVCVVCDPPRAVLTSSVGGHQERKRNADKLASEQTKALEALRDDYRSARTQPQKITTMLGFMASCALFISQFSP